MIRSSSAFALATLFLVSGCAGQAAGPPRSWYAAHDGVAPRADRIYVCHAFGCARKTAVSYSGKDLAALRRILSKGRASPAAERKAIADAVAWAERKAGPIVGSDSDVGGFDLQNSGVPGQMDCLDEATNTTSVLLLAADRGYLVHHTVLRPVARGFFLDGRYPHATAVIRSTGGETFAVDSWPEANGIKPVIQPLSVWFAARS
ncbi:hypothetical protein [Stappia sp. ES.058]|uniref:hypothetical protein n=1 Tax=Stappia sp. ES.058 TaxID=1881061 RepID=UPI0008793D84|nr:hypothetical protein [Stappia sp. ES.058]SDU11778.1 hypothetical protein SAMN05428979_1724 [Stappia sp. ES.058]